MSCNNVIIFYEYHSDKSAAKTLKELLPFFKEMGIKSYGLEIPNDVSLSRVEKDYKEKIFKLNQDCVQWSTNPKLLIETAKSYKVTANKLKETICSKAQVIREELELFNQCKDLKINLYTVDIDEKYYSKAKHHNSVGFNLRNKAISEHTIKHCTENGGIVIRLGVNHYEVADLIAQNGINVREYFIYSQESLPSQLEVVTKCFRLDEYKDDPICIANNIKGLSIDLYSNPNQDPVELIIDHEVSYHNHVDL